MCARNLEEEGHYLSLQELSRNTTSVSVHTKKITVRNTLERFVSEEQPEFSAIPMENYAMPHSHTWGTFFTKCQCTHTHERWQLSSVYCRKRQICENKFIRLHMFWSYLLFPFVLAIFSPRYFFFFMRLRPLSYQPVMRLYLFGLQYLRKRCPK